MAGRPLRRAMLIQLEKRAKAAGEGVEPIDVVCEYIAAGADDDGTMHTLAELARELTKDSGETISPGVISSWVNSTKEFKAKIDAARALAAHVLAESSISVVEELAGTEVTKEEIALAKARSDTRQWLASKWNRAAYGNDVAQVNLQVNMPGQHLEALKRRAQIKASTPAALPPSEPDVEYIPSGEPEPEGDEK